MSLYGVMRTSVSGMNAQANRLSTVAENVANVNTTGYKTASCEFSSLLLPESGAGYESGAVLTSVRNHITSQGNITNTTSVTDLAINGDGFFVVTDTDGTPFLTRAGSFVPNSAGVLVNAAGFTLQGYKLDPTMPPTTVNGYSGMSDIDLGSLALSATASTEGSLTANLPASADIVTDLPSGNSSTATYTAKSSLLVYDTLGAEVKLDVYFAKSADGEWDMSVFNAADADPSSLGFPYASGPLATQTLNFDTSGKLTTSPASLDIPVPGGDNFALNFGKMTQLAAGYVVLSAEANGNPPSGVNLVEIAKDGTVYASYGDGSRSAVYRIPLAHVTSPDKLAPQPGNVFTTTSESGNVSIGFAGEGGLGTIFSNSLEQSTVDLAGELTAMIDAQRSYTANSKVFQTGSELMDVLVNLKR